MKYDLTISPFNWELDDGVEEDNMDGNLGLCDYVVLTITMRDGLKKELKQAVLLHELGHAFFASAGFDPKEEERIVDIYASQMLAFLKNNKEFFKKYFLEDEESSK